MRISALVFFYIIMIITVDGQNSIQGYILDKQYSNPLPYATIGEVKQQYGAYSDTLGLYKLYYKDENENDTLKISYLGYFTIITTIKELKINPNIFLEPNQIQIKEIVVKPNKKKKSTIDLGYFTKEESGYILPPNELTHATFIPFPKDGDEIILKSVNFRYRLEKENSPIRIRILNVGDNGEPGEDILIDNLIFNNYKKKIKGIAKIDIDEYGLIMPHEGVFIVLEMINIDKSNLLDVKQRKGPAIGSKRIESEPNSLWFDSYNYNIWYKPDFPFKFTIGLTVINYTK